MVLKPLPVMKHLLLLPGILLALLSPSGLRAGVNPSDTGRVVLMRPCHLEHKGVPLLEVMPADDPRSKTMDELVRRSFIGELATLHRIIQDSLLANGLIGRREPLYLLASGRMGGFPMRGFYLKSGGRIHDKTDVPYVDLPDVEQNYRKLESITQIFPHEQAHIYLRQFSGTDPEKVDAYSSDIHYFSMITNYSTAFDEGFAESFENISRSHEPDGATASAIRDDAARTGDLLRQRTRGFDRDFRWPLRLGLYRLTMLLWYQQLEDYKRYEWVRRGLARYHALPLNSASPEKRLLYINACAIPDTLNVRNRSQCASTEGVINTFFTLLMESRAKEMNRPDASLTPMQNQLMKEFHAIALAAKTPGVTGSRFDDFVSAYIARYPSERELVLGIYRKACGFDFTGRAVPEIWLFNPGHRHNCLVMAQYGGSEIPYYTMNLNTARVADLVTFAGMDETTARDLARYRDSVGGFGDILELQRLPGRLREAAMVIERAKLDPAALEKYGDDPGFTISGFLMHTGLRAGFLALVLLLIALPVQLILAAPARRTLPVTLKRGLALWFKVLLFLAAALLSFLFRWPPLAPFTLFTLAILALNLFRTRHDTARRREIAGTTLLLFFLLGYSLV